MTDMPPFWANDEEISYKGSRFVIVGGVSEPETIGGRDYLTCLLLVKKMSNSELEFCYAFCQRKNPDWTRGRGRVSYVNMQPDTLVSYFKKPRRIVTLNQFGPS